MRVRSEIRVESSRQPQREITKGTIALYKEYTGRGPTFGRTFVNDDSVTVVLGDSLLPAEKVLVADDRSDTVRQIRHDFQLAMREPLKELVEASLDRKVLCMLSDHSPEPDYAVEVFVLEPDA